MANNIFEIPVTLNLKQLRQQIETIEKTDLSVQVKAEFKEKAEGLVEIIKNLNKISELANGKWDKSDLLNGLVDVAKKLNEEMKSPTKNDNIIKNYQRDLLVLANAYKDTEESFKGKKLSSIIYKDLIPNPDQNKDIANVITLLTGLKKHIDEFGNIKTVSLGSIVDKNEVKSFIDYLNDFTKEFEKDFGIKVTPNIKIGDILGKEISKNEKEINVGVDIKPTLSDPQAFADEATELLKKYDVKVGIDIKPNDIDTQDFKEKIEKQTKNIEVETNVTPIIKTEKKESGISKKTQIINQEPQKQLKDNSVYRKVYYHGSNEEFDKFDVSLSKQRTYGSGGYLTGDKVLAKRYGTNVSEWFADVTNTYEEGAKLSEREIQKIFKEYESEINQLMQFKVSENSSEFRVYDKLNNLTKIGDYDISNLKGFKDYLNSEKILVQNFFDALAKIRDKSSSSTDIFKLLGYDSYYLPKNDILNVFDNDSFIKATDELKSNLEHGIKPISIKVKPDTSHFTEDIQDDVQNKPIEVPVKAKEVEESKSTQSVGSGQDKQDKPDNPKSDVDPSVSNPQAFADNVTKQLKEAGVKAKIDVDGNVESPEAFKQGIENQLADTSIGINVAPNEESVGSFAEQVESKVGSIKVDFTPNEQTAGGEQIIDAVQETNEAEIQSQTQVIVDGTEDVIKKQQELQNKLNDVNVAIKNQQDWLSRLNVAERDYTTSGKQEAINNLRAITNVVRDHRNNPNAYKYSRGSNLPEDDLANIRWYRSMQEAERQGVSDKILRQYNGLVDEYQYEDSLREVGNQYNLHLKLLIECKEEARQYHEELLKLGDASEKDTYLKNEYQKLSDQQDMLEKLKKAYPSEDVYIDEVGVPNFDDLSDFINLLKEYGSGNYSQTLRDVAVAIGDIEQAGQKYSNAYKAHNFIDDFNELSFDKQISFFDEIVKGSKRGKENLKELDNEFLQIKLHLNDGTTIYDNAAWWATSGGSSEWKNIRDRIKEFSFEFVPDTEDLASNVNSAMEDFGKLLEEELNPVEERIKTRLIDLFKLDDKNLSILQSSGANGRLLDTGMDYLESIKGQADQATESVEKLNDAIDETAQRQTGVSVGEKPSGEEPDNPLGAELIPKITDPHQFIQDAEKILNESGEKIGIEIKPILDDTEAFKAELGIISGNLHDSGTDIDISVNPSVPKDKEGEIKTNITKSIGEVPIDISPNISEEKKENIKTNITDAIGEIPANINPVISEENKEQVKSNLSTSIGEIPVGINPIISEDKSAQVREDISTQVGEVPINVNPVVPEDKSEQIRLDISTDIGLVPIDIMYDSDNRDSDVMYISDTIGVVPVSVSPTVSEDKGEQIKSDISSKIGSIPVDVEPNADAKKAELYKTNISSSIGNVPVGVDPFISKESKDASKEKLTSSIGVVPITAKPTVPQEKKDSYKNNLTKSIGVVSVNVKPVFDTDSKGNSNTINKFVKAEQEAVKKATQSESEDFNKLEARIRDGVTKAINDKTEAIKTEAKVTNEVLDKEIKNFQALAEAVSTIANALQSLSNDSTGGAVENLQNISAALELLTSVDYSKIDFTNILNFISNISRNKDENIINISDKIIIIAEAFEKLNGVKSINFDATGVTNLFTAINNAPSKAKSSLFVEATQAVKDGFDNLGQINGNALISSPDSVLGVINKMLEKSKELENFASILNKSSAVIKEAKEEQKRNNQLNIGSGIKDLRSATRAYSSEFMDNAKSNSGIGSISETTRENYEKARETLENMKSTAKLTEAQIKQIDNALLSAEQSLEKLPESADKIRQKILDQISTGIDTGKFDSQIKKLTKGLDEFTTSSKQTETLVLDLHEALKEMANVDPLGNGQNQIDAYMAYLQRYKELSIVLTSQQEAMKIDPVYKQKIEHLQEVRSAIEEVSYAENSWALNSNVNNYSRHLEEVRNEYSSIREAIENNVDLTEEQIEEAKRYAQAIKDTMRQIESLPEKNSSFIGSITGNLSETKNELNTWLKNNFKVITKDLDVVGTKGNITTLTAQAMTYDGVIKNITFDWNMASKATSMYATEGGRKLMGITNILEILRKKTGDIMAYWAGNFLNPFRIFGFVKQGVNVIRDYDDALIEMKKVSDETTESLTKFQRQSFKLADGVGTTALQIQKSTADFLRLGEAFEDAQKFATSATVLMNVSEFENINEATDALISMRKAYEDVGVEDIIDKLNTVGVRLNIQ